MNGYAWVRGPGSLVFWKRGLSSLFAHANFVHIAMNMMSLRRVGPEAMDALDSSPLLFLCFYLACGFGGHLGTLLYYGKRNHPICVGASGAILGLTGAVIILRPNERVYLLGEHAASPGVFLVALVMQDVFRNAVYGRNINVAGHVGGVVTGIVLSSVYLLFL